MVVTWVSDYANIKHDDGKCEICNEKPAAFICLDCGKKVCIDEISKHYELCHNCSENIKHDYHEHGGGD
ncbi:hypothetical protein A2833_03375 [Candidatus Azambacteria bacterium RIFCSPHIGHO2_01_FULL_44_55]|nr:MAG: hypothetical protein A3A18_00780 [Candidatus Azambacteria bacterium RIFCSPLOWO2_01_FULL_44_84]OGD32875.1 MAG: hypothetical protein A3C78_00925 [Candidatus Azambacteria bacterium RIFCSPHIGHO2_02_FULL_45_18]OGD39767.1 MAG: hypothetical protein A2833_03375 [Candidatus Azambacteria bacterium RIFCSPHIGHO2_01_FULL_44_55]OGD52257.1 MAG: hypothetical protein A2608_02790 [Candidatus Azambacteria bacterium RIFOXYD1_FULL_44_10]